MIIVSGKAYLLKFIWSHTENPELDKLAVAVENLGDFTLSILLGKVDPNATLFCFILVFNISLIVSISLF